MDCKHIHVCQVALFPLLQPEVPIALFTVWKEKLMPVAINTYACDANGKVTNIYNIHVSPTYMYMY